jgi:outer membrane protein
MKRLAAAAAALLAAAPALRAQEAAVPRELSLQQAVALAQGNNPDLLTRRNDLEVANGAVRSAMGDFLPTLNANLGFGYTAGGERRSGSVVLAQQPSVYSSSFGVSAGYSVTGARLLAPRVARDERRATNARLADQEAVLTSDVTQRYLAALQASEQVGLADREIARARQHQQNAQDRLQAGQVTPLDVRRAEVQVGRAELRRVRAANALAVALQGLGRSMGVHVDTTVRLTTRPQVFDPTWTAAELVQRALRANSSLTAAAASAEAADTRVRVARTAYWPSVSLGVAMNGWKQMSDEEALLQQRLGTGTHDSATVARIRQEIHAQNRGFPFGYNRQPIAATLNVSLPIFQGFSRGQQVRQARATAEDARLQLRSESLRIEQEVTTALLDLKSAREAGIVAERVRAAADEELQMAQERFRLGLSNALAVLDAQGQLADAEQEQSTAVFDFHRALARLEALVGEPLH